MRRGFTLIELLAVIVVLAIIALIATPIVLNIIKDTKESAQLRSAEMYLRGVEYGIANMTLSNKTIKDDKYNILEDGNICIGSLENNTCTGEILEVEVNGETPNSGYITIESAQIKEIELTYSNNKTIVKNEEDKLVYSDEESDLDSEEETLAPGLYDENDNMTKSWEQLVEENALRVDDGVLIRLDDYIQGKLVLDSTVTSIPDWAFYDYCEGLTSITIPDSVTEIGEAAFGYCRNLTSITIGSGVTNIANGAFTASGANVTSTTVEMKVDKNNPVYDSRENCNAIIETSTNTLLYGGKDTIIPDTVTSIDSFAFRQSEGLTSITIPDSVTSIGTYAFDYCINLTSVTIGKGVTSIGGRAFDGCKSLKTITIPDGVTSIGYGTFNGCSNLTSVTIPDSVTSIDGESFSYCEKLTSIYIPSSVTTISTSDVYDSPFLYCSSALKIYSGASNKQSGWGTYWNYYDRSNTLDVIYGKTRSEYESIIAQ